MKRPKLPDHIQAQLGRQGTHSHGKYGDDDDGDLALAIAADPGNRKVVIDFGTPISWLALDPQGAMQFASTVMRKAILANRGEPLSFELPTEFHLDGTWKDSKP